MDYSFILKYLILLTLGGNLPISFKIFGKFWGFLPSIMYAVLNISIDIVYKYRFFVSNFAPPLIVE